MAIEVRCQCGRRLQAPPEFAGKTVRCPACKTRIELPGGEVVEANPWSQFAAGPTGGDHFAHFSASPGPDLWSQFPAGPGGADPWAQYSGSAGQAPPGTERCEYCHQYVPRAEYVAHVEQHRKRRADGQQTDYATLPPEMRRPMMSVASAPRAYVHRRCGAGTEMPLEIVKTYLTNPWFYLSNKTYCCGCEKHVPLRECSWDETGENLQSYTDRLRAMRPDLRPNILIRGLARVLSAFFS